MEKEELYLIAKKAYYEGEPIMGDMEFDSLETELGLENQSFIGGGSTPNFTVQHPFKMGSLSKIQVKEDSIKKSVNWGEIYDRLIFYIGHDYSILTPKYDGCSFEMHCVSKMDGKSITISTRGDGDYGKDIYQHLIRKFDDIIPYIKESNYTLRGEILINKNIFKEKYSNFTNPRSFVAGLINRKYEDIEDVSVLDDLSIVIYDYRVYTSETNNWQEHEWTELIDTGISRNVLPTFYYGDIKVENKEDLEEIYKDFDNYRKRCPYALDGIVAKPNIDRRINNTTEERPRDCVAIKFLPMICETTVTDILWQLGKTGEYTPVVYFDGAIMDGKKIIKASGSNYGNLMEKGIGKGAKIKISLAGDIIPFIYEVVEKGDTDTILENIKGEYYIVGCHLYKKLDAVESMRINFLASCKVLNITNLGDKQAQKIFDGLEYKVEHIFFVDEEKIEKILTAGEGKTAQNIIQAIKEKKNNVTLTELIASMNLPDCGIKCSEQCARYLTTYRYDFSGLSKVGWEWVVSGTLPFDAENEAHKLISKLQVLVRYCKDVEEDKEFEYFIPYYMAHEDDTKIKVILTGSPKNYKNKKEFLLKNPEYVETSKWNECKVLFTGDLTSTSSKMKKAEKLGIEIKEY